MAIGASSISRAPRPSSLADVLDLILDKGLVIDAYVRVSLAGIELLTIDARVVVASVDTYLRFAEAVNRLDLTPTEEPGIPALFGDHHRGRQNGRNGHGAGNSQRDGTSERDGRSPSEIGPGSRSSAQDRGQRNKHTSQSDKRRRDDEDGSRNQDQGDGESESFIGRIAERARR
jgi:hypothetical protein